MDAKVTLSFDERIINKAKEFANDNNMSLSRLIEFLLKKITTSGYKSLEDFPISNWVSQVAEGEAEYYTKKKSRKSMKEEFYSSKK